MKLKKSILAVLILLMVLTVASVSASEDIISDGNLTETDEDVDVQLSSEVEHEIISEGNSSEVLGDGEITKDSFYYWSNGHTTLENEDDNVFTIGYGDINDGQIILTVNKDDGNSNNYTKDIEGGGLSWQLNELDIIDEVGVYSFDASYINDDTSVSIVENYIFTITQLNYDTCAGVDISYPFDVIRFYGDAYIEVRVNGEKRDSGGENPFRWTLRDLNINGPGDYNITIRTYDDDDTIDEFNYTFGVGNNTSQLEAYSSHLGIRSWELDGPVLYMFCPDDLIGNNFTVDINGENSIDFTVNSNHMNWTLEDLKIDSNGDYEIRFYNEEDNEVANVWLIVSGIISEDAFNWWIPTFKSRDDGDNRICEVWLDDSSQGSLVLSVAGSDGSVQDYEWVIDGDNYQWVLDDLDVIENPGDYTINLTYVNEDTRLVLVENQVFTLTQLNYYTCGDLYITYPFDVIRFYSEDGQSIEVYVNGEKRDASGENPFRWTLHDLEISNPGDYTITIKTSTDEDEPIDEFSYTLSVYNDTNSMRAFSSDLGIERWDLDAPVLYLICPDDVIGNNFRMTIKGETYLEFTADSTLMNWTLDDLNINSNDDYEINFWDSDDNDVAGVWLNVHGILSEDCFDWWIPSHESLNDGDNRICEVWLDDISQGSLVLSVADADGSVEDYEWVVESDNYQWTLNELDIMDEPDVYTINLTYVNGDTRLSLVKDVAFTLTKLNYYTCDSVYIAYPFDVIRFYSEEGESIEVYVNGEKCDGIDEDPIRWTLQDLNITEADDYDITIKSFDEEGELIDEFSYTLSVNNDTSEFNAYSSDLGIESWEAEGPVVYLICPDENIGDQLTVYRNDDEITSFEVTDTLMNWTFEELGIDCDGDYDILFVNEGGDEIASTFLSVDIFEKTQIHAFIWNTDENGPFYSDMDNDVVIGVSFPESKSGLLYVLVNDTVEYVTLARHHDGDEDGYDYGYSWRLSDLNLTLGKEYNITLVFFNGETNETIASEMFSAVEFDNSTPRARYVDEKKGIDVFCPENAEGNITILIYSEGNLIDTLNHTINASDYNKWKEFNCEEYWDNGYDAVVNINDEELYLEGQEWNYNDDSEKERNWIDFNYGGGNSDFTYGEFNPGDDVIDLHYPGDEYNVTVTITNGDYTITKTFADLGYPEWDDGYTYFITYEDLEAFDHFNDKDTITVTFEYENGKQTKITHLQKDGDVIRLYKHEKIVSDMSDLFMFLFGDEEEGDTGFNTSEVDTDFIQILIPGSYNVTEAEISLTSGNTTLYYKSLTDFEDDYEFDYNYGENKYIYIIKIGDVDFANVKDGDIINCTLIFDGKVVYSNSKYKVYFEEDIVSFNEFLDKITGTVNWGEVGHPEYGQSESTDVFIEVEIPNFMNITEGSIQITADDGEVLYSKSLSEFNNTEEDEKRGSKVYEILASTFDYSCIPDSVNLTFSFNYNDTQLVFAKGIRVGNNMYRHVIPEELQTYFEVTLQDKILIDGEDNAIYIHTTSASNVQSVPIALGSGYICVYVNGKKIEDLGRLIRVSGETELDLTRLLNDYNDLYIYLKDINITDNGVYGVKVTYEVDADSSTTGTYKTELYNRNITLTSNVKVENATSEVFTGFGLDPVLLYLDTYYGEIDNVTGKVTVLNSDGTIIFTSDIKKLSSENGRYYLKYSDFENKEFGDNITVMYADGNERNGNTTIDVLWKDVNPTDFTPTVNDNVDDYYGDFVNLNIPELITTGQIIVTIKFKGNHTTNIPNMNVTSDYDSQAVYKFNVADIKANYETFGLSLSNLGFYEDDGSYDIDVEFTADGVDKLDVTNSSINVKFREDIPIAINETSRFGLELPFAVVKVFEPVSAYVELYIDGKLFMHKSFEDGEVIFNSSASWTPGNHTAEIKVINSEFASVMNSSSVTFETFTKTDDVEVTADENIKENEPVVIKITIPEAGNVTVKVDDVSKVYTLNQGENSVELGILAYGNHTIWILYENNDTTSYFNDYLNIFVGDDGRWLNLPDPLVLNDDDTIKMDFGEGAEGNVVISIDGVVVATVPLENGSCKFKLDESLIPGNKYGVHTYNITYSGDGVHDSLSRNGTFNVSYIFKDDLIVEGYPLMEYYTFDVILPADATGRVTVSVDGVNNPLGVDVLGANEGAARTFTSEVKNGKATFTIPDLAMGEHKLFITYEGNEIYPKASYATVLNVTHYAVIGEFSDDKRIVSLMLPSNATGNLTIFNYNRNVQLASVKTSGAKTVIDLSDVPVGIYEIRAYYDGDDYDVKSFNTTFRVMPDVIISQGVVMGDNGTIFMDLDNATGHVVIAMDGLDPKVVGLEDGIVNYTFSTEGYFYGNHTVNFLYFGKSFDGYIFYEDDEKTQIDYDLLVLPKNTTSEGKSDSENHVTFYVYDNETGEVAHDAEGNITVFINGVKYAVLDVHNGQATLDLPNLKDGDYVLSWMYSGDKKYASSSNNMMVNIKQKVAKITAKDASVLYSAGTTYSVTVYNNDGSIAKSVKVQFLIDNKAFMTVNTNDKGIATVKITQNPGTYKITTKALGVSATNTLKVQHVVKLKKVNVKRSAKKLVLKATLKKVNGKYLKKKKVTFKFNGKKYAAKTNKKGVAKVTIKSKVLKKLKKGKKVKYQVTYKKDTVKRTVKVKK